MSAFLSAGRSVTFYLRSEQKDSYDGWSPDWRQALVEDARKLLDFMNAQRVAEVHVRGAEAQGDVEMVPVTKLELNPLSRHAYDLHWCDEFGTLEVGHVVHHFEIDRTRERVTETCKRYVALLEKLVQEFDQAFP